MNDSFFEKIQSLSEFWKRHHYCLQSDKIEKGIRFLATSTEEFRSKYSRFYLTKIVNTFCVFEHDLKKSNKKILFRLFKSPVVNGVLGVALATKITETEFLSKESLLRALSQFLPGIVTVPFQAYQFRDEEEGMLFMYQEIERKRGRGFLPSDIQKLKKHLAKELEESIAAFTPSLFLIRNEEEIFRNIVQMSREFNSADDIPQVTISFQEQTAKGFLRFSVVVVRLVKKNSPTLKQLSLHLPHTVQFIPEMSSEIGTYDKEISKQANIVTFEVEGSLFVRKNGSIDLREARAYVAKTLELMIGEFRDYNGGLFSKQYKHLKEIQETLGDANKIFFESLFYAFTPSLFQTFVLPEAGLACATLFLEAKNYSLTPQKYYVLYKHHEKNFSLVVVKTSKEHLKNEISKAIANFSFPLHQFGYVAKYIDGEYYLGLIYQYPTDPHWFDAIEKLILLSQNHVKSEKKILRINFQDGDPLSLSPHIGIDLRCRSLQKSLFEGLTRIGPEGALQLAAAKEVETSGDGKNYLFTLRQLQWSNGEELTAHQIERSWKDAITSSSCLRPDLFDVLKNARNVRLGKSSIDEIGVKAVDKKTLRVSLEYPAPYFLNMLAHPLFFPVYEMTGEPHVFCGPFTLHSWQRDRSLVLIKNPFYWDCENVKLDGIEISIIRDSHLAFQKYEQGELDWIGGPFSLLPPSIVSERAQKLTRVDTPGVVWVYCNLANPLLSSAKIRRALSHALDREKICQKTLLNPIPLHTQLPAKFSYLHKDEVYSEQQTKHLFEEGMEEMKCSRHSFSALTFLHSHITGQKELAIEVQRQWQNSFDIKIQRVEKPWNTFSHQLDNRLIHFGSCYRHPFYDDAMYFFQMFYDSMNIHNAFGWHSETYNQWIDLARTTEEPSFLKLAEQELWHQMPVIPLHMVSYYYLARKEIKGIYFCHSGDVDFKWIRIEEL